MMKVMSKRTMKRMTLLSDFSPSSKSQMLIVRKSDNSFGNDTINDKNRDDYKKPLLGVSQGLSLRPLPLLPQQSP